MIMKNQKPNNYITFNIFVYWILHNNMQTLNLIFVEPYLYKYVTVGQYNDTLS